METRFRGGVRHRVLRQVLDRAFDVVEQKSREIAADPVTDQDALDDGVLAVRWQRIGRDLPAPHPHSLGQVIEGEAVIGVGQPVGDSGQAAVTVIDHLERPELRQLGTEPLRGIRTGLLDGRVAFAAQAQEVVVLRDDLATGAGEVQREGRHVAAEIVDVEDQLFGQVFLRGPDRPSRRRAARARTCGPRR